jgi:hypothetical protein
LRRDNVKEIELSLGSLSLADRESSDARFVIDRNQVVVEETFDITFLTDLFESSRVFGYTEHRYRRIER